jgi:hypothetical protein
MEARPTPMPVICTAAKLPRKRLRTTIFIGLGFMAGSAAAQQAKLQIGLCPACGKKLTFDPQVLQTKADPARKVCLPCPTCAASLVVDADTCEVTQALTGTDPHQRSGTSEQASGS